MWAGTTPLVVLAGLALFVAGLDTVEPLAQEVDHPSRRDASPLDAAEHPPAPHPDRRARPARSSPAVAVAVASLPGDGQVPGRRGR